MLILKAFSSFYNKQIFIAGCESGHCNLTSPSFLEWDALTVILEGVMQRVTQTDQFAPPVDEGLQLLRDVLAYNTQVSFL